MFITVIWVDMQQLSYMQYRKIFLLDVCTVANLAIISSSYQCRNIQLVTYKSFSPTTQVEHLQTERSAFRSVREVKVFANEE